MNIHTNSHMDAHAHNYVCTHKTTLIQSNYASMHTQAHTYTQRPGEGDYLGRLILLWVKYIGQWMRSKLPGPDQDCEEMKYD